MKILWLPPDYHETEHYVDMGSNILILQYPSSQITFMEFDLVYILPLGEVFSS